MKNMVDVVIPVYKPDEEFEKLLTMLSKQTVPPQKVIFMETESDVALPNVSKVGPFEVVTLQPEEFDHAGTRNQGSKKGFSDYVLLMTQDAIPRDEYFIENMLAGFLVDPKVKATYARQIPKKDCKPIERLTRSYNYPRESFLSKAEDIEKKGIKTFFMSDVACMYERATFERLGGFSAPAVFNEDMLFAHRLITAGFAVYYNGDACVYHSHNLSLKDYFKRNFDLGASQAMHPEVFETISSESEGKKMVKEVIKKLFSTGRWYLVPLFILQCGAKYLGFKMGKKYDQYSIEKRRKLSSNPYFWKE